ncbi:hypothetical protein BDN72DRAFT_888859 [Pluteus cervinus]|uniref:Uncharacterized protein n=1 Tax=Pluteus cervinus TaxID=181527 RepID=A0ACD3APW6_9AGAR|nr:hypothetical protein BDN72DRAFT_888859 [Pluteus cervinus]
MLSSPPPSSSYKSPPLSKRHSLSITTTHGPRPLHLVDGNVPSTAPALSSNTSLSNSPLNNGDSRPSRQIKATRRQSSICYYPSTSNDNDKNTTRSTTRPHSSSYSISSPPSLSRNNSFGSIPNSRGLNSPRPSRGDRRSISASVIDVSPPVLERPPLTLTEKHGELLQSIAQKEQLCLELRSQLSTHEAELAQLKRKWEFVVNRGYVPPTSAGLSGSTGPGGAVLEGIKEGVQGVGKILAAGLSMSDEPLPASPVVIGPSKPSRIAHSANTSSSSVSTTTTTSSTTKSTRFSQSSFSSIGEEGLVESPKRQKEEVLMQKQRKTAEALETSAWAESRTATTSSKMHRRKSREVNGGDISSLFKDLANEEEREVYPEESAMDKAKRRSLNASGFPPVSSIPGLGTLTTVAATSPMVSSWVGNVGKRWDQLQRNSSFSKNQKRATVILSDVSQTIVSTVLGSGSSLPPSTNSSATSFPFSSPCSATSAHSLLDDDDVGGISSFVMSPDSLANSPTLMQPLQPTPVLKPVVPSKPTRVASSVPKPQDDDDTWNW